MKFAEIRIPVKAARRLAIATDHRTAVHDGYVVKTFLAEAFGTDAVRPWRMLEIDGEDFVVLGAVREEAALAAPRIECAVRTMEYTPKDGDSLDIEVHAIAVRRVRERSAGGRRDATEHKVDWVRVERDVATVHDPETGRFVPAASSQQASMLYSKWIMGIMVDAGAKPVDLPKIVSTRKVENLRKRGSGDSRQVVAGRYPSLHARMRIRIEDAAAFGRLTLSGVGKHIDIGMGAVLPEALIDEVMS